MKATAQFSDPSEAQVTIVLTGSLKEFEELRDAMMDAKVPYWQSRALIDQVSEAAYQLRSKVTVDAP